MIRYIGLLHHISLFSVPQSERQLVHVMPSINANVNERYNNSGRSSGIAMQCSNNDWKYAGFRRYQLLYARCHERHQMK